MKGTTTALLNVREKGHFGATILGRLPVNTEVEIISKRSGWGKIDYQGKTGYVCLDYITLEEETPEQTTEQEAEHNANN